MEQYPVKILQFGEGNFLRAFADDMIDRANEAGVFLGSVVIIKPIAQGSLDTFKAQRNRYTLIIRGIQNDHAINGSRVVTSISDVACSYADYDKFMGFAKLDELKIIISNTTEAGIVFDPDDRFDSKPPASYPGKLTKFLFERYLYYSGDIGKGLYILPCELIENNGQNLEKCVKRYAEHWTLPDGFPSWIDEACCFCDTLVDRIVTGFDKELSEKYNDKLLTVCEPFALWVIEDKKNIKNEFPLNKAGMPVVFATDVTPYRERKVRILNGSHASIVAVALLSNKRTVGECMRDTVIREFMEHCLFDEIIPFIKLDKNELLSFADSVFERFENPFNEHELASIAVNLISKWKARLLVSVKDFYRAKNKLPRNLIFSFSALLSFYMSGNIRDSICDTEPVIDFFKQQAAAFRTQKISAAEFVTNAAENVELFGEDLTALDGFADLAIKYFQSILQKGVYESLKMLARGEI